MEADILVSLRLSVVNLKDFANIAKDILVNTLILEESQCSYKRDTSLDLYIRFIYNSYMVGIYQEVDNFNFRAISYISPNNNIYLHYRTLQLIHNWCGSKCFTITQHISCSAWRPFPTYDWDVFPYYILTTTHWPHTDHTGWSVAVSSGVFAQWLIMGEKVSLTTSSNCCL